MTAADQFYFYCPSNSSMSIYVGNKISHFTTKLSTPLEMNSEYEVGLSEIQYPNSWYNIRPKLNQYVLHRLNFVGVQSNANVLRVKPKYYHTVDEVIGAMDKRLLNNFHIQIRYDSTTRRVTIVAGKDGRIKLRNDLARVLGFDHDTLIRGTTQVGAYLATPSGGFTAMYVYTDIIQEQFVGDYNATLLRTIPIQGRKHGDPINSNIFNTIYYMPVSKRLINTIEIKLADDGGAPVVFTEGKVIVVLHFRRKKSM